ncbi:S-adenosyl-L-methionine-dependent methyltransferase [Xylaria curta]|nr:S-adenosyl-L-methionine-dependent methyltransferase [Xylaria curta]
MPAEPDYVFTRDHIDNNRLNLQHYQWIELFGYHLHPQISVSKANLCIADVATGTGIWLTDMSGRLPATTRLEGLDISLKATPPAEWLPPNVTFRVWDIKQAVPESLVGKYDVVHVRLLSFVLRDDEVPSVLQNLTQLIKPGGYLQWAEPDVASFRIEKTHPGNNTDALERLLHASQGQDSRLRPTWVPQLGDLFSSVGKLCDVHIDVRDAPGYLAMAMHECNITIHELLCRTTRNKEVSHQLETLLTEAAQETREGACWAFTRWTVVGKKPANVGDADL